MAGDLTRRSSGCAAVVLWCGCTLFGFIALRMSEGASRRTQSRKPRTTATLCQR